jgi:hypothetical protein
MQGALHSYEQGDAKFGADGAAELRAGINWMYAIYMPGQQNQNGQFSEAERHYINESAARNANNMKAALLGPLSLPAFITRWFGGSEQTNVAGAIETMGLVSQASTAAAGVSRVRISSQETGFSQTRVVATRPYESPVPNSTAKGPVSPLEVGKYGDLAPRSRNDGLTPDHIPSYASVKLRIEALYGRELTELEAKQLMKNTNTIIIGTKMHQQVSRTYGGRNLTLMHSDANKPGIASILDQMTYQPRLLRAGYTQAQIDSAFRQLRYQNVADGRQ